MEILSTLNLDARLFALIAACNYALSIFILRKRLVMLLDPLHVGVALMCFGLSIGAAAIQLHSSGGIVLFLLLSLVYYTYIISLSCEPLAASPQFQVARNQLREDRYFQAFAIILASVILLNAAMNVLASGFHAGSDDVDAKSLVSQNRALFLFAFYFSQILFGFVYVLWGTPTGFYCAFVFILTPVIAIMSGQKGGVAGLIVQLSTIYYLKIIDTGGRVGLRSTLLQILGGLVIVASFVLLTAFLSPDRDTLFLTLWRVFVQFDQIMVVIITDFPVHNYHLDIAQWYFGSPLKVLGLYTAKYDSIGQFIYSQALGYPSDFKGILPNENIAAEFAFGVGPLLAVPLLMLFALAWARLYKLCMRSRYDNVMAFVFFMLLVNLPLGFINRGSATFIEFYVMLGLVLPFWLAPKIRDVLMEMNKRPPVVRQAGVS